MSFRCLCLCLLSMWYVRFCYLRIVQIDVKMMWSAAEMNCMVCCWLAIVFGQVAQPEWLKMSVNWIAIDWKQVPYKFVVMLNDFQLFRCNKKKYGKFLKKLNFFFSSFNFKSFHKIHFAQHVKLKIASANSTFFCYC